MGQVAPELGEGLPFSEEATENCHRVHAVTGKSKQANLALQDLIDLI